jgi:hypothetical protein
VCKDKKCSASITVFNNQIIKINGNHVDDANENSIKISHKDNHPGLTTADIIGKEFKNDLKTTIKENPNRPIQQIYQDEQSKIVKKFGDMTVAAVLPQFESIQSGLFKQKASLVPPLPQAINEIKIEGSWAKCEDDKRRFLLHHDNDMIIFGSGTLIFKNI